MARVWIGNFKGPKGDKGDKGDVGPQGPMGPQGPVGLVNSEGAVEFEDYTSAETVLPTAEEALDGIVSGSSLKGILGSIKAFCKNILSVGMASSELIGDAFSLERPYSAGEYVIKDNVMYRFTTDKEAGEWDETVVEPTKMAVEVQALSANLQGVSVKWPDYGSATQITPFPQSYTATEDCWFVVSIQRNSITGKGTAFQMFIENTPIDAFSFSDIKENTQDIYISMTRMFPLRQGNTVKFVNDGWKTLWLTVIPCK